MVATHFTKTKHSALSVTGVYLRGMTNTVSPLLHLNVSHLSICFSCSFQSEAKEQNKSFDVVDSVDSDVYLH